MKKSTALIIFVVYIVSIVMIGFLGMAVKAYDIQKYIEDVQMSVEAENENMFKWEYLGKTKEENNYKLIIYLKNATQTENGKPFIALTLIPRITYEDGELNAKGDGINYSVNPEAEEYRENGNFSLDKRGILKVNTKRLAFSICVKPKSINGSEGANIEVHVQ